jgi:3-oxoacyl-[acyl-carrier-protein] synthase II
MALVGGCESKVNPMALMRWSLLNRLSTKWNDNPAEACRPYDAAAEGCVLAEGGAVLIIEDYEHAKARGATIYAEIIGLGASANATQSVIEPDPTGEAPAVAIRKALKDAKLSPEDIQLIIPPGYSVPNWDKSDAAALHTAFGPALQQTVVAPMRGGIGDCGAGSQALDLVAGALALKEQVIPPAVNAPNPIANLPISSHKQSKPLTHVLSLETAFGGQNSAIILKRVP